MDIEMLKAIDKEFEKRKINSGIKDGVYDATGIDYLSTHGSTYRRQTELDNYPQDWKHLTPEQVEEKKEKNNEHTASILSFIEKHPNYIIARAYEVDDFFLLSEMPKKFEGSIAGSQFNYGVCSIINNCPEAILILAEND